MRRREFIIGLGGAAAAWPHCTLAQHSKIFVIGLLSPRPRSDSERVMTAFREGMRELGYIEGTNFVIEERYTDGQYEPLSRFAEELVAMKVDVIVAVASPAVRAAQRATSRIPIVIAATGDAVQSGLVTSLSRPGGNTTGSSNLMNDLITKHFQLMMTLRPNLSRIAVLLNPGSATRKAALDRVESAGRAKSVSIIPVDVRNPQEIENGFAVMRRERVDGIIILADAFIFSQVRLIARLAMDSKLPSIFEFQEYPEAGGLLSYGAALTENFRRTAIYVDKILKGAKPADLPIEQPTKFELVINLKTAEQLGIDIPAPLLHTADKVIE
jgi:putative ABC transport system substrate-binding protein